MSRQTTYARRSGRVILLDADDRVLLFKFEGYLWITPGGGVNGDEPIAAGASRELREETGLEVDPGELRHIAFSEGFADLGWIRGILRDDYFLLRVPTHEVDISGLEKHEVGQINGWHWWSVPELRATNERVIPLDLAQLVTDVIEDRIPSIPWVLRWHL